jgi:hypothetical protein
MPEYNNDNLRTPSPSSKKSAVNPSLTASLARQGVCATRAPEWFTRGLPINPLETLRKAEQDSFRVPETQPLTPLGTTYEITVPPIDQALETIIKTRQKEKYGLLNVARFMLPDSRVAKCQRLRVAPLLGVKYTQDQKTGTGRAFYSGLMSCSNVWDCPHCSSKISEKKRIELAEAMRTAKEKKWTPYMVTFTAPHHKKESLKSLLRKATRARQIFFNRKAWRTYSEKLGLEGHVRALEVTHSYNNGWHVHVHQIFFFNQSSNDPHESMLMHTPSELVLLPMWQSACLSAGLRKPNEHGLKVDRAEKASNYISKFGDVMKSTWTASHEMTKSMIKKANEGKGMSPWDMLRDFQDTGDEQSANLFREYSKAFKGKRQLVWSKGLREKLGLDVEKTDQELAEEEVQDSVTLGYLTTSEWKLILKHEQRAQLLQVASSGVWDDVQSFLRELKQRGS